MASKRQCRTIRRSSVNRHGRFRESAAFRLVFESVVATCMKVGLVGGEGFAVDASVVTLAQDVFAGMDPTEAAEKACAAIDALG